MKRLGRVLLPLLILALGIGAARWFVSTKPAVKKRRAADALAVVEAQPVTATRFVPTVSALGTVQAAREVSVLPEVSGKVVAQHPKLIPGSLIRAGEELVAVDRRDYELAVQQQEALVEKARLDLELEQQRKGIAEREWRLMQDHVGPGSEAGRRMALREPYLEAARAALTSAKAGLTRARLNLERTSVRAPFDAIVKEEFVDLGQQIGPQTRVATLVGVEEAHVIAALPEDRLASIALPGPEGQDGARVRVVHAQGEGLRAEREGVVRRLLPDLDPRGRTARLLIALPDPFGVLGDTPRQPFLLGALVEVEIEALPLDDVLRVPRSALREGDSLWVVDAQGSLRIRQPEVVWRGAQEVALRGGITEGERLITGGVAAPVDGMRVRVSGDPEPVTSDRPSPGQVEPAP